MAAAMTSVLEGASLNQDFGDEAAPSSPPATPTIPTPAPSINRSAPLQGKKVRLVGVPVPVEVPVAAPEPVVAQDFGDELPEEIPSRPEPVPNEPAPAIAPEAPPASPHSQQVLDVAATWGIGPEEALLYQPEELKRELLRLRRDEVYRRNVAPQVGPYQQQQQPVTPPAPPEPEIDWGVHDAPEGEGQRAWTDRDIAPAIAKVIKEQAKEMAALKEQVKELKGQQHQQSIQPLVQRVKASVAKFGAFLGNGEPKAGSPELMRCQAIMQALEGMSKTGRAPNPEVDVPEVVKMLFGDLPGGSQASPEVPNPPPVQKPVAVVDPAIEALRNGYANGVVHKPTQRNSPVLPYGEKRAKANVSTFLRSKGVEPTAFVDEETEFG